MEDSADPIRLEREFNQQPGALTARVMEAVAWNERR